MSEGNHATVAVTGVTGALGSRIASRLSDHGVPQLLVGRSPDRMPELPGAQRRGPAAYADADASDMRKALKGASTLILVSGHRTGRRLEEHATAVEAAIAVGVDRVLYVSLVSASPTATYLNARDQWLTEQFLAGAGIRHTVLRSGFYTSTPAALANEEFVVNGPGSTGRAAFVTHEDIADVITAVALDEGPRSEHDGA
ncbi:NAD(P)H-binding protein, partial [Streptomyces sp. NPDC059970]|uniref:NAD(P)H-binding protein n=1 Tax=Streptomyces sp. NPDC059970 TaxID=3347019 RepID=UPI0036B239C9